MNAKKLLVLSVLVLGLTTQVTDAYRSRNAEERSSCRTCPKACPKRVKRTCEPCKVTVIPDKIIPGCPDKIIPGTPDRVIPGRTICNPSKVHAMCVCGEFPGKVMVTEPDGREVLYVSTEANQAGMQDQEMQEMQGRRASRASRAQRAPRASRRNLEQ